MADSLRTCVTAFCLHCQGQNPWAVAKCEKKECALHPVRPNQALQHMQPEDFDPDALKQEILDALDFKGLQEMTNVRSSDSISTKQRTRTGHSVDRAIHAQRAAIERAIRVGSDGCRE